MTIDIGCYTFSENGRRLKEVYETIVKEVFSFMEGAGFEDPVSVFAIYVYMLRSGFLSYNGKFFFDERSKDFLQGMGIDVIRGKGLCRHIASMLFDIYQEFGFDSALLLTNSVISSIRRKGLCDVKMNKGFIDEVPIYESVKSRIVRKPNHLINICSDGDNSFILCPTGDIMFDEIKFGRFLIVDRFKDKMLFYNSKKMNEVYEKFLVLKEEEDIKRILAQPIVNYDSYKDVYLEALAFCQDNTNLLRDFRDSNRALYDSIYESAKIYSKYTPVSSCYCLKKKRD